MIITESIKKIQTDVWASITGISKRSIALSAFLFLFATLFILGAYLKYRAGHPTRGEYLITMALNGLNSIIFVILFDIYVVESAKNSFKRRQGFTALEFQDRATKANKKIICMSTYFGLITKEFGEPAQATVRKTITDVLSNNPNMEMTIIVLSPMSKAADQRYADLRVSMDLKNKLQAADGEPGRFNEALFELYDLKYSHHEKYSELNILTYDSIPPFFMIQFDLDISIIHYLPAVPIQKGNRLDCKAFGYVSSMYEESLQNIQKLCTIQGSHVNDEIKNHVQVTITNNDRSLSKYYLPYYQSYADRKSVYVLFDMKRPHHKEAFGRFYVNNKKMTERVKLSQLQYTDREALYLVSSKDEISTYVDNKDVGLEKYNVEFGAYVKLTIQDRSHPAAS